MRPSTEAPLAFQIVCGISVLQARLIGAGGIQHHEAEHQKEQDNKQKGVILRRLCLFGTYAVQLPAVSRGSRCIRL